MRSMLQRCIQIGEPGDFFQGHPHRGEFLGGTRHQIYREIDEQMQRVNC